MSNVKMGIACALLFCGCDAVQRNESNRGAVDRSGSAKTLSQSGDPMQQMADTQSSKGADLGQTSVSSNLAPRKIVPSKFPIVLHHGYMAGENLGSFKKIQAELKSNGIQAFVTLVPPSSTIEARGEQLETQLQQILKDTGASRLNIIAHSQGGLDARFVITSGKLKDGIASLSTLSTPHLGTSLADYILENSSPIQQRLLARLIDGFARVISSAGPNDSIGAARALSVNYVTNVFNPKNPDQPNILYQSWAAQPTSGMKVSLSLSSALITSKEGPNDGIVSTKSASHGDFRGVLDADHLDLIGVRILDIGGGFDHNQFYLDLVSELAAKGL
jgi:triacylglycerol lipase